MDSQTRSAEALCMWDDRSAEILEQSDVVFIGRIQSINPLPPGTHWNPPPSDSGRRRLPATAAIVFELLEVRKADHDNLASEERLVAGYVDVDYHPDAHDVFQVGEVWHINAQRIGRNLYFVVRCGHSHPASEPLPPPRADCGGRCSTGSGSSPPFAVVVISLCFLAYRRRISTF